MRLNCYLRKGVVYLPTFAKLDSGAYMGIEPIAVVPVSAVAELRRAFQETVARGNPVRPHPKRADIPPNPLLKLAGVKTDAAFERGALTWRIVRRDGIYRIEGQKRRPGGGWVDDPDQVIEFPPTASPDDVIDRMIAILQAEARTA